MLKLQWLVHKPPKVKLLSTVDVIFVVLQGAVLSRPSAAQDL